MRIDPCSAHIAAHIARCNANLGVVANSLHFAGIRQRVDLEGRVR
jgi:hypothetical protein